MSGEVDPPDGGDDQVSAAMSNPDELIEEQDNKGPTINHLDFSVEYISPDTMPRPALQVLGRKTDEIEEAYTAACGKIYRLPLFPMSINPKSHKENKRLNRVVTSVRVRRLVLTSEINDLAEDWKKFQELEEVCFRKKKVHDERLTKLEAEMNELATADHIIMPGNRFSAALFATSFWNCVTSYLTRECHRVQQEHHFGQVERLLTLQDIQYIWQLIQKWHILKYVELRCRIGLDAYIAEANKKDKKNQAKDIRDTKDDVGLSSDDDEETDEEDLPLYKRKKGVSSKKKKKKDKKTKEDSLSDEVKMGDVNDNSNSNKEISVAEKQEMNVGAIEEGKVNEDASLSNMQEGEKENEDGDSKQELQKEVTEGNDIANDFLKMALEEEKDDVEEVKLHHKLPTDLHNKPVPWELIQHYLQPEGDTLVQILEAVKIFAQQDEILSDSNENLVQNVTINHISAAIHDCDTPGHGDKDHHAAGSITNLMDDIGACLENKLIGSLRLNPYWQKMLEQLRKERVKREGGKLIFHGEGEVEMDAQGVARKIPNSDNVVDTDIFHGSMQRMEIQVILPEIAKKRVQNKEKEFELLGELTCVIQYGYENAVVAAQRMARGLIAQKRAYYTRRELAYYSAHIAAVRLQAWARQKQAVLKFAETLQEIMEEKKQGNILVIQKNIRRFIKYKPYRRRQKANYEAFIYRTVSIFQALIRGFNCRRRKKYADAAMDQQRDTEEQDWAATQIQKMTRGRIARTRIVHSLHVRRTISKDLLKTAEKYLEHGDLWGFLEEIDMSRKRLQNTIMSNQKREDEMAATFVERVLKTRQGEFDAAWDKFGNTVKEAKTGPGVGKLTADTLSKDPNDKFSAISTMEVSNDAKKKKTGKSKKTMKSSKSESKMSKSQSMTMSRTEGAGDTNVSMLQGPLLRRAVTATVRDAVTAELEGRKKNVAKSVKLIEDLNVAYGDDMDAGDTNKNSVKSKIDMAVAAKRKSVFDVAAPGMTQTTPKKPSMVGVTSSDWVGNAVEKGLISSSRPPLSTVKIVPGESLLLDIPKGLDDTAESLLRAAALRTYVPEFFPGHTPKSAYEMYLKLPPGLSKIRYEQEAWKAVQNAVNGLRIRKLKFIKDILPFSKMSIYLKTVECPNSLIDTCKDIVTALRKMGAAPSGMKHKASVKAFSKKYAPLEVVDDEEDEKAGASVDGISIQRTEEVSEDRVWTAPKEDEISVESMTPEMRMDATLPGRILEYHTSNGHWTGLKAPSEELMLHAGFLICPHVVVVPDGADDDELTEKEMGHNAFKNYIRHLQRVDSDEERREITRGRFRAALILTTPYTLRLQAEGNYSVEDLITENLPDLNMPKLLQMQVESLISIVIGFSVRSKAAKVPKNYKGGDKNEFDVPMIYDPKFQRGPLDPYGRAPRMEGLDKLFKKKREQNATIKAAAVKTAEMKIDNSNSPAEAHKPMKGSALEKDDASIELPIGGIWEPPKKAIEKEHRKVWKFHSTINAPKYEKDDNGYDEHGDQDGISWGGTGTTDQATKRLLPDLQLPNSPLSSTMEVNSALTLPDGETTIASPGNTKIKSKPNTADRPRSKPWTPKQDFESHVRGGFERPYKCTFPGCDQAFSRQYTLATHMKSHELQQGYHSFKREPMLFLDPDMEQMKQEAAEYREKQSMLPPLVIQQIEEIRTLSSKAADRPTPD